MKKKEFQSALFSPIGWWTGNNFIVKGGLIRATPCDWAQLNLVVRQ